MIGESWLWNKRMGNLNFEKIMKVSKKGVVRGLPKIMKPLKSICKHCQHGKQTKANFKEKEHTTSHPLEIVHTDICGPTRTKILQGEYHFMLFIVMSPFLIIAWQDNSINPTSSLG